jgi:ribosome recycling factor
MPTVTSPTELFEHELQDMYYAEKTLTNVLPKLAKEASDGELVRIPIPPLTQERRKELVKVIKRMAEETKVALRNSRREANDTLREFTDAGEISEDDEKTGLKKVQDLTDKYVGMVDEVGGKKEKEILEF